MYAFEDKKSRAICLVPEVTAPLQQMWRQIWSKEDRECYRVLYVSRCYRYERPQANRYREFTQLGVEILGKTDSDAASEVQELLVSALDQVGVEYSFESEVKRGLNYYTELGFEAICPRLGPQKQIAGGGQYSEGVGWAIGVDRLVGALLAQNAAL